MKVEAKGRLIAGDVGSRRSKMLGWSYLIPLILSEVLTALPFIGFITMIPIRRLFSMN